jgi:hypothetical protein
MRDFTILLDNIIFAMLMVFVCIFLIGVGFVFDIWCLYAFALAVTIFTIHKIKTHK